MQLPDGFLADDNVIIAQGSVNEEGIHPYGDDWYDRYTNDPWKRILLGEAPEEGDRTISVGSQAFKIKKYDFSNDQMIVYGEVYAPYVLDSHSEMMLPVDIRLLAHRFLIAQKNKNIDLMHNNKPVQACMVESFIARAGDPDYTEGAWVLAVQVFDRDLWSEIRAGKYNGYSLEALVYKVPALVVYDYLPIHMGITEENDGHDHVFWVEVGEEGRVIGGFTSPAEDGHVHQIRAGTATEESNGHQHRYFLNEFDDEN